jgi:protein daughter of sevenless
VSSVTETTNLEPSSLSGRFDQLSIVNEYENDNVVTYRQSDYSNRATMVAGGEVQNNNQEAGLNYSNLPPMERPQSSASRTSNSLARSTGAIKKIPENLKLRSDDKINNNNMEMMYRASGPYIPLSDCFSGSPVLFVSKIYNFSKDSIIIEAKSNSNHNLNLKIISQPGENDPKTPLNSLDPKFYDTPRSHITNIGLNLTDDQPNSPKRNNIQAAPMQMAPKFNNKTATTGSVNSSPTDSEGGSTDEEWTEPKAGRRKTRPSDSSMENESIAITAGQCYTKMPGAANPIPLPPKRISLVMEKKQESSDTEENASPLMPIGPKDSSSCVDERYDFPRSYNGQPGFTGSHMNFGRMGSMTSIHSHGQLMTSTPNLIHSGASTLDRSHMNFYSNAAPRENNVFRFDFSSNVPAPPVNRGNKPKMENNGYGVIRSVPVPPEVDRRKKPGTLSRVIFDVFLLKN